MSEADEQVDTPGWDAIEAALARVYEGRDVHEIRALLPYALGGPDPIEGIQAYWNDEPAHWHLISFGFSELYTKETNVPEVSGYGFELTIRVAGPKGEGPPEWAHGLLHSLGRYVFESGHPFLAGDQLALGGPIAGPPEGHLAGITFVQDPGLPQVIDTPHGSVQLLQVVGLTADELEAARAWSCEGLVGLLSESDPLLLTDPQRPSLLASVETRRRVEEGSQRDGSSLGSALVPSTRWEADGATTRAIVGASAVPALNGLLRGRIVHGRSFLLIGEEGQVSFAAGETSHAEVLAPTGDDEGADDEGLLAVTLTPALAERMAGELVPQRGAYTWRELPGFTLEVIPSEITDPDGNPLETIG